MTNKEVICCLTNKELASFLCSGELDCIKKCAISSFEYIEHWLGQQAIEKEIYQKYYFRNGVMYDRKRNKD